VSGEDSRPAAADAGSPRVEVGRPDRVVALGDELIRIHQHLRDTLNDLRTHLGEERLRAATRRSLQEYCVGFCAAVTAHHTAEDRAAFPLLAAQYPELAPVLAELRRDHELVAGVLQGVEKLVRRLADGDDPALVRSGIDGLSAILESHFGWEERRIAAALDSLATAGRTSQELLGMSARPD
jgi:hemerythrin-like domain-containing protein